MSYRQHRPRMRGSHQFHQGALPRYDSGPSQYDSGPQPYDSEPQHYDSGPSYYDSGPQYYDSGPQNYDSGSQHYDSGPKYHDSGPKFYDSGPQHYDPGPQHYDSGPPGYDESPPPHVVEGPLPNGTRDMSPHVRGPPPHVRRPPPHVRGPPSHVRGPPPQVGRPPLHRGQHNQRFHRPSAPPMNTNNFMDTAEEHHSSPYQGPHGPQLHPPLRPHYHSPTSANRKGPPSYRPGEHGFQGGHFKRPLSHDQPQKKKKQKLDSRDKAENNQYYCDICDRGFKTNEKFKEHVDSHQECREEGCSYIAAPKLIQLHYQLHHKTGLAKKIWQIESQEDIAKWISERKRNFPTKENKERKTRETEERTARGEVLQNSNSGKMRGRGRNARNFPERVRNRGRGRGWKQTLLENHSETMSQITTKDKDTRESTETDPLALLADADSDEDKEKVKAGQGANKQPEFAGGLGVLANSYGELSDSDVETTNSKVKEANPKKVVPERVSDQPAPPEARQQTKSRGRKKGNRGRAQTPGAPHKQPTLLQKLLANEIRHERNVILQCVRYVLRNDFLQARAGDKQPQTASVSTSDGNQTTNDKSTGCDDGNQTTNAEDVISNGAARVFPATNVDQQDVDIWDDAPTI